MFGFIITSRGTRCKFSFHSSLRLNRKQTGESVIAGTGRCPFHGRLEGPSATSSGNEAKSKIKHPSDMPTPIFVMHFFKGRNRVSAQNRNRQIPLFSGR